MLWCDFASNLRKINPRLWVNLAFAAEHHGHNIVGIFYDKDHVCSMTYDDCIPYENIVRKDGIITHRGLKEFCKLLLKYRHKNYCLNEGGVEEIQFTPIAKKKDIAQVFRIDPYLINPEE